MVTALRQHVTVQPGGLVEVRSPDLRPGEPAEVIVLLDGAPAPQHDAPAPSWAEFIGTARGSFKSVEAVDAYVRELRDEWDR